ncbi:hypothetical protein U1Q18_051299 [Sarracenia purpurea var. burkii]
MKITCDRFGKHHCQAVEDLDENDNETTWCDKHKCVDVFDKNADLPNELIRGSDKTASEVIGLPLPIRNSHKKCKKKCSGGSSRSNSKSVIEKEEDLRRDLLSGRFSDAVGLGLETNLEPRISIHR